LAVSNATDSVGPIEYAGGTTAIRSLSGLGPPLAILAPGLASDPSSIWRRSRSTRQQRSCNCDRRCWISRRIAWIWNLLLRI